MSEPDYDAGDPDEVRAWFEEFEAAARRQDRESLPRLRAFREYWIEKQRQGEIT